MLTTELTRKIDLLSRESYIKVENFLELFIASDQHSEKESAFRTFMDKMNLAEKSVQENGYYSEEEVKAVLDKVQREERLRGVVTGEQIFRERLENIPK